MSNEVLNSTDNGYPELTDGETTIVFLPEAIQVYTIHSTEVATVNMSAIKRNSVLLNIHTGNMYDHLSKLKVELDSLK